jgi:hypothetical protein
MSLERRDIELGGGGPVGCLQRIGKVPTSQVDPIQAVKGSFWLRVNILDMTAWLLGWSSVSSRNKAPVTAESDVDKPENGALRILEIAGHV